MRKIFNGLFIPILTVCFLSVFLFSCQNNSNNMDQSSQSQLMQQEQISYEQTENSNEPNLLFLAGGSETDVREPHPVSNALLQKKYPNIVVLNGSKSKNQVALTFDDGPDVRFTPQVLDVLAKYDVKATFFLIGARAKAHSDITKRIHEEGHAIGNHTYWHPNLSKEKIDRLHWELTETEKAIEEIVGFKPRLFRPPYGALNEEAVKLLGEQKNSVIIWNVDSLDWKQLGADVIADNVLSNVRLGSIILMHDGGDWSMDLTGTVQALDRIIMKLKEDGTKFVTIPELIDVPEAK